MKQFTTKGYSERLSILLPISCAGIKAFSTTSQNIFSDLSAEGQFIMLCQHTFAASDVATDFYGPKTA